MNGIYKTKIKLFDSLIDFTKYFNNENKCRKYLHTIRWGKNVNCPRCGCNEYKYYETRFRYTCHDCKKQYNVKTHTIFEGTKVPLEKWFIAIYLVVKHKKGISSLELSRMIKVNKDTAWRMQALIRKSISKKSNSDNVLLSNIVEVDETFIGGKEINKKDKTKGTQGNGSKKTKSIVLGIYERFGKLKLFLVKDKKSETINEILDKHVRIGSSITTDGARYYSKVKQNFDHSAVIHSKKEFVNEDKHLNNIETIFRQLKNQISGTHHFVSDERLLSYLDIFCYRFNNRKKLSNLFNTCLKITLDEKKFKRNKSRKMVGNPD